MKTTFQSSPIRDRGPARPRSRERRRSRSRDRDRGGRSGRY